MKQELGFHLDMETEKNLAAGMDPREARRRAHLRLGGMVPIQEAVRDARGVRPVLTHGIWQRRFGGTPSVLGRIIEFDGRPTEVVGVLPASFRFPRFEDLAPPLPTAI